MSQFHNAVLSGSRVLVVEDDYLIAQDLCRSLRENGATVLGPAPTAHYAYNLLFGRRGIDGAILDVRLHGSTVFELAKRLRELNIPMLFTTGHDRDIPAEFGNEPRMLKPLSSRDLIEKVRQLVRREDAGVVRAPAAAPLHAAEPPSLDMRIGRSVTKALRIRVSG